MTGSPLSRPDAGCAVSPPSPRNGVPPAVGATLGNGGGDSDSVGTEPVGTTGVALPADGEGDRDVVGGDDVGGREVGGAEVGGEDV